MKKHGFSATSLKLAMIITLALLTVATVGGFYYTQDWLNNYAAEVNQAAQKKPLTTMQSLSPEQLLASEKVVNVFANSDYQSKATQDLNTYASATQVTITDISTTTAPAGAPPTPAGGIQPQYIKVTVKNPVSYSNFIKFIKAVETNLPIMRLTGVDIRSDQEGDSKISVQPLIVEVYVK